MQTIEEYKDYTAQLEAEVKKWRDAYNAMKVENVKLVIKCRLADESVRNCNQNLQELLDEINHLKTR